MDPRAVRPITNLALAWIDLHRYADAESAARRAIAADPGFTPVRRALTLAQCGTRTLACRVEIRFDTTRTPPSSRYLLAVSQTAHRLSIKSKALP